MYFFAATGVTPAMDTQIVGEGSTYPWMATDADNNPLDGGKSYRLRLPPHVPVKTFWSVIVYDAQTRSMLQTDTQFPSVSSQNKSVQSNPDGSVDVYFGPRAPAGRESNWIQTVHGSRSCASTARWNRGSSRNGGRMTSSCCRDERVVRQPRQEQDLRPDYCLRWRS